jgi:uncharacterized protein (UPF0335 family)
MADGADSPLDGGASSDVDVLTATAQGRLKSFIERIERLEEDKAAVSADMKGVFDEAKGEGFDVKILKEIIKLRKQDQDERDEHDSLLDVYMRAMDEAGPVPVAEAA